MKIFIILLVLAFISASHEDLATAAKESEAMIEECTSEANADPDAVKDYIENNKISDDENFKCFLNCFANSMALLKPSGDIDSSVLKTILTATGLTPDEANEVAVACGDPNGDDGCEIAYNLLVCIEENVTK